jgi:hypothetical protein
VEACIAAVKAGKLKCVKFLHEHGCTRDAGTTYAAAVGGQLDCLRYAHEHGCPCIVAQLLAIRLTVRSRRCLEYVRGMTAAERALTEIAAPRESKHQRYVRRWQQKQARQVHTRAQDGKRTAARKADKAGAGRGCR